MKSKNKYLQPYSRCLILLMTAAALLAATSALSSDDEESSSRPSSSTESLERSPLVIDSELLPPDQSNFGEIEIEDDDGIETDLSIDQIRTNTNDNKNNKKKQLHQNYLDELNSDEYDDTMFNIDFEQQGPQQLEDYDWDLLIFTQQWPVTTCYHWREEDRTHACLLPMVKEFWTIHGVWPTKLGHFGPCFCNKTANFNIDQLQTIMDRMKQFWPDIDGQSQSHDWLWKHEWLKHGTCAALLAQLDNELKYFGQGLIWRDQYSMRQILSDSNIHPDSNNTVIALQNAILKGLNGKNPSIHCLYDNKHDVSYLAEIRICFNKTLELTDCNGVKHGDAVQIDYPGGTVITNCHISKPVHYPSLVPPVLRRYDETESWKFPIVNMYKLLQFIMWFTL